jgi:flagellar basal-body rod protein FlgB
MEIANLSKTKLFDSTMSVLKKTLDFESANQQVITGNMANADTPGYRQMTLKFSEELQKAEGLSGTTLKKTNERHLSESSESINGFSVETKKTSGIDMDTEMADMAKNNLLYTANSRLLTKKFQALKAAIKGSY